MINGETFSPEEELVRDLIARLAQAMTETWLWTRGKTKEALEVLRHLQMKQQQRKLWESYARIRFPTLIGADN